MASKFSQAAKQFEQVLERNIELSSLEMAIVQAMTKYNEAIDVTGKRVAYWAEEIERLCEQLEAQLNDDEPTTVTSGFPDDLKAHLERHPILQLERQPILQHDPVQEFAFINDVKALGLEAQRKPNKAPNKAPCNVAPQIQPEQIKSAASEEVHTEPDQSKSIPLDTAPARKAKSRLATQQIEQPRIEQLRIEQPRIDKAQPKLSPLDILSRMCMENDDDKTV